MLLKIKPQALLKLIHKRYSSWPFIIIFIIIIIIIIIINIDLQALPKLTYKCYSKLLKISFKLTHKRYSKLLKIFASVIQTDPQALLKTNFKGVTKLENLFGKTAQLKSQTK